MRRIVFIICIVALIIVINNLGKSIYELLKKQDIITTAQLELEEEKRENQRLKSELAKIDDENFIEQEARDKLFLVKPGEAEVILPGTESGNNSAQKKEESNFKKWLKTFGF